MPVGMHRFRLSALVLALSFAAPAQASSCWRPDDVAAAMVRNLQSQLMVAALRCRTTGVDVTPAYNRFVVANRSTLRRANRLLLSQFRAGFGEDGAQAQFDEFATRLANAHSIDTTSSRHCSEAVSLAEEGVAEGGALWRLAEVGYRVRLRAPLPGGVCPSRGLDWLILED